MPNTPPISSGVAIGPVLLIGGSGMLGRAFRQLFDMARVQYAAPTHAELDVCNGAHLDKWVSASRSVVINASAWTDVDGAEANEAGAMAANASAVGELVKRCIAVGALLAHYSTDYVFEGTGTPLATDGVRKPVNAYGRSKAKGEELLEELDPKAKNHVLIRTSWLYAPWGKNFVRTIAGAAKTRPGLKVVNDQHGRPTSCEHLAKATLRLIQAGERRFEFASPKAPGAWHITDAGQCSWFDFATRIALHANPACKVEPCGSDAYPRPARRPAYSVMDISRSERLLGKFPSWEENLDAVLGRLE
jgi:dTDP-4-dehydrorhamnose reductase